ncbi:MAG: 16S rRNA (cytosine(1402)-N(4))-methyltransferase RsmH [Bacteroidia bacterium]|nr:16S rRNA (cytosine(1402)-N(4))-methyltransferase RsmH [Bacteroidia bacterium]
MDEYHVPVLLDESIEGLNIQSGGIYVDVTYGGGGHSAKILEHLEGGTLVAFDQDIDATDNLIADDRLLFVRHNFKYLRHFLKYHQIDAVDGILADLGVSSHDFDVPDRGFSFRFEGNLDMRMNQSSALDAARVINEYREEQLWTIFQEYGEIKNWRHLVSLITAARATEPITTIGQFLKVIEPCVPMKIEKKYLAMVFQALRIEVNNEIGVLRDFLESTTDILKPGGRLVVLSYHSLEDRLVKNFMRSGRIDGKQEADFFGNLNSPFELINRKIILPSDAEIARNPRARSAKLRIAEKK